MRRAVWTLVAVAVMVVFTACDDGGPYYEEFTPQFAIEDATIARPPLAITRAVGWYERSGDRVSVIMDIAWQNRDPALTASPMRVRAPFQAADFGVVSGEATVSNRDDAIFVRTDDRTMVDVTGPLTVAFNPPSGAIMVVSQDAAAALSYGSEPQQAVLSFTYRISQ